MMENQEDKMMRPEEVHTLEVSPAPETLTCVRECVMPGIGTFAHGQIITDPAIIAQISGNPHFMRTQEVV